MAHHLDSPAARQDIRLDITDLYVFRGESGTTLIIDVCHSIAGPVPVPGYHPEGMYEFKIDTNGDAIEDITYRFTFADRNATGQQRFLLRKLTGANRADPSSTDEIICQGITGREVCGAQGFRIWAGKASDPFWIEPDVLHAVRHALQDGTAINLAGWDPAKARNLFAGHTVYSIVLEVPDNELLAGGREQIDIGVWAIAANAGGWRPVNRVGLPMIHPLFTQFHEDPGDRLNAGRPTDDFAKHGAAVSRAISAVVATTGTVTDPVAYGDALARRFFPNILPYRVGTQAAFSFAKWNGRALTDNVPNVIFSLATNTPVDMGIGRESVPAQPTATFPYVVPAD